ncbi:hypothetical protein CFIMG_007423RA00001 [Ceratocystis fimbriata CBS 114723]|uniref:Uncharacterized protein n=1 Tax=Ceratocystis fimbriata CBS 114723 TaxID=1035309 RepID=A0A2C5WXT9_9PEZI|nr:hypothetical protein CFIMG_007423RA00001 [Ceratocystis fimbriata CBS 114723]
MADTTSADIEVLVHLAAPSTATDDAYYHSLARGYLDFAPGLRIDVVTPTPQTPRPKCASHHIHSSQGPSGSDDMEIFGGTQASFSSVLDNSDSPRVRMTSLQNEELVERQEGAPSPLVSENGSISHVSETQLPSPVSSAAEPGSYSELQDITREESNSPTQVRQYLEQVIPPSSGPSLNELETIPSSIAALDQPLSLSQKLQASLTKSFPEPRPQRQAPAKRDHQPPLQRSCSEFKTTENGPRTLTKTISDTGPFSQFSAMRQPLSRAEVQRRLQDQNRTMSTSQQREFQEQFYDALEIYSPEPEVCDKEIQPEDLITAKLHQVSADLNIIDRFKFKTSRKVESLERGFWLIDTSEWQMPLREAAWKFLANWVGAGFAGWGTRCYRNEDRSWIRVYCWGVVVGPIYGMIYLASERRLKTERSEWIDGDGEAVVVVAARDNVSS